MAPVRKVIPPLGMIDLSPIVVFIAISRRQSIVGHCLCLGLPGMLVGFEHCQWRPGALKLDTETDTHDARYIPPDSVGLVTPQTAHFDTPLALAGGKTLDDYTLVYETCGQLNAERQRGLDLPCPFRSSPRRSPIPWRIASPAGGMPTSAPARRSTPTASSSCRSTTSAAVMAPGPAPPTPRHGAPGAGVPRRDGQRLGA